MRYEIYNNEELINTIIANQEFVDNYCQENGYTYKAIEDFYDIYREKQNKILKSKEDLAVYLSNHPLQWTDGNYYSITQEKQNQLTSKIMAATMAQTLSQEYNLTWNSTGEVCQTWTLQDLSALAFAIDARVTKLVSYQQEKEVEIKNAQDKKELEAIIIDYDSVE